MAKLFKLKLSLCKCLSILLLNFFFDFDGLEDVLGDKLDELEFDFTIDDLEAGIYFVRFKTDMGIHVEKLIKT